MPQLSLTRRLAISITTIVMAFVVGVGVFSYISLKEATYHNINSVMRLHGEHASDKISESLNLLYGNLIELSANTLVGNALVDDLGRDVYLAKFLEGLRRINGLAVHVALTNFKGEPIAQNDGRAALLPPYERIAKDIDNNRTSAILYQKNGQDIIAFIKPVIYANTGLPEGALIYQVVLDDVFGKFLTTSNIDDRLIQDVSLVVENKKAANLSNVKANELVRNFQLKLPVEFESNSLIVRVSANPQIFDTLIHETLLRYGVVGGAVLVLAVFLGLLVSRILTARFEQLKQTAVDIARSGNLSERLSESGGDEITDLAGAFNTTLDKLEQAYIDLELQSERKLHKLHKAIDVSTTIVILADSKGVVEFANPAFEEITGFLNSEIVGKHLRYLLSAPSRDETWNQILAQLLEGKSWQGEFSSDREDGSVFWCSASLSPIREGEEELEGFVAILEDITKRKEVEDALKTAKIDAENASKAKSEFLANMSHELRTPLNSIIGFSEMMHYEIKGPLPHDYHEYSGLITTSGRLLLETVNAILDLSKIEAGKMELDLEDVNMGDIVDDAISVLDILAKDKGVELVNDTKNMHTLLVDRLRMKQLFMNLIGNALKFTDHGSVRVYNHCDDTSHNISVEDTGIGMSDAQIEIALQPFQQVHGHAYARRYQGTGLGLSLSQRIMELHNGTLSIKSVAGKGTRVTISFPANAQCD